MGITRTSSQSPAGYSAQNLQGDQLINRVNAGVVNAIALARMTSPYPVTAAEIAVGVAVVNPAIRYDSLLRYGVLPNLAGAQGITNAGILQTLFNAAIPGGPTGQFYFPNITGGDIYHIDFPAGGCITVRDGCRIELQNCILAMTGTGVAADSNSGFWFALRDFGMKNGTLNVTWATGPATSAGNAIAIGARGTDSVRWPVAVYDSLLPGPLGNAALENLKINMAVTGANLASSGAVSLTGGIQGLLIDKVRITGSGTLPFGVVYEFGWATNEAQPSARQSSHMHDFAITRCNVSNMDNASAASGGLVLAGAYQGLIENYSFSGVSNGVLSSTGESMFFRPMVGIDDIAGSHSLSFRNITGKGFSNSGLTLSGTQARAAGSGYLQRQWVTATNYSLRETVINGGNMYVCTVAGLSGPGPAGTAPGAIVDNTVTWNYVSLSVNVDQLDYTIDGNCNLNGAAGASGIASSAGYLEIKGSCTLSGMSNGLFFFAECTRFSLSGIKSSGAQTAGFEMATTAGQIWPVVRLKKGAIRDCYVWGNSLAAAGASAGIHLDNCSGVVVDNNRINLDVSYGGVAEVSQGTAVQVGANGFGVSCRNNHVGNIVGANFAYLSLAAGGALNGNDIVNPLGAITQSGPWNNNGVGNATGANLAIKTANVNVFGKMPQRFCFNASNSRLLIATGPNNTDNWAYADGNAPGTITPV